MSAREKLIAVLAVHESNRTAMTPLADEILAIHRREIAAEIQAEIENIRAADWGKHRGKTAYIQGLGSARRIVEKGER